MNLLLLAESLGFWSQDGIRMRNDGECVKVIFAGIGMPLDSVSEVMNYETI